LGIVTHTIDSTCMAGKGKKKGKKGGVEEALKN